MLVPESMGRLQSVMPHAVLLYIGVCVCVWGRKRVCVFVFVSGSVVLCPVFCLLKQVSSLSKAPAYRHMPC